MKRVMQLTAGIMLAMSPCLIYGGEPTATVMQASKVGVVSVRSCVDQSKDGMRSVASIEALSKQMNQGLEELTSQIEELSTKMNNDDLRAGLAPDAEKALQDRFDNLAQEHELKRMQFGQQLNQAQMAAMQQLFDRVSKASEAVATQMGIDIIIQEDSTFFFNPKLDITQQVIDQMDKQFAEEQKIAADKAEASKEVKKEEPATKNSKAKK